MTLEQTDVDREPIPFVAPTDRLLRPRDVAAVLSCGARTVYTMIQTGELPGVRVGMLVRVRQSDLDAWIAARPAIKPTVVR